MGLSWAALAPLSPEAALRCQLMAGLTAAVPSISVVALARGWKLVLAVGTRRRFCCLFTGN